MPWTASGGMLVATAAAMFTAPLTPSVNDLFRELDVFLEPGGQTGAIPLTRYSTSSPGTLEDLASGAYPAAVGPLVFHLDHRADPMTHHQPGRDTRRASRQCPAQRDDRPDRRRRLPDSLDTIGRGRLRRAARHVPTSTGRVVTRSWPTSASSNWPASTATSSPAAPAVRVRPTSSST